MESTGGKWEWKSEAILRINGGHPLDDEWLIILCGFDVSLGLWCADVGCDGWRHVVKVKRKVHADGPRAVKGERE